MVLPLSRDLEGPGRSNDDGVQWTRLPDVSMANVNVPGSSRPLEKGSTLSVAPGGSTMFVAPSCLIYYSTVAVTTERKALHDGENLRFP